MKQTLTRLYALPFQPLPKYTLKCGLEIHTQLKTKYKLFSFSNNVQQTALEHTPNKNTSYFDLALPGTQPILNYEAVLLATKLGLALQSNINLNSTFDRKHYFYGDQPLGYQITQHYAPFASGGYLRLSQDIDGIQEPYKDIRIIQLQIEQDTGKSIYKSKDGLTLVDLNRSNVPLIEMVTEPDFNDLRQIKAFVRKFQNLVRHLEISTGDLEAGAMRVDVNVSINKFPRVELKNLPNTSSILNAIAYEYQRQVEIIEKGQASELLAHSETRGWTGSETIKLRSKETTLDYRYMPDTELPPILLDSSVPADVSNTMPPLPDEIVRQLMREPYNLSSKDAKILTTSANGENYMYNHHQLREFYLRTFHEYKSDNKLDYKLPINWTVHELLGDLNKLQLPFKKATEILTPKIFARFLNLIYLKKISKPSGKLLLFHILQQIKAGNIKASGEINLEALIKEFSLETINLINQDELKEFCQNIIDSLDNQKVIEDIITGRKPTSIKYLIGKSMRLSQGRLNASDLENMFRKILHVK